MIISRKAIALAAFVLAIAAGARAQVRLTREEYVDRYKHIAVAQMERYGIPASITMAQGILESDCGNSLLSMIMQLSMSIGVTIAGLLLGLFGSQHVSVDSGTTQTVFMYTWLSMALIIALPAFIFARVPNDTHQNVAISRRKRSAQ